MHVEVAICLISCRKLLSSIPSLSTVIYSNRVIVLKKITFFKRNYTVVSKRKRGIGIYLFMQIKVSLNHVTRKKRKKVSLNHLFEGFAIHVHETVSTQNIFSFALFISFISGYTLQH